MKRILALLLVMALAACGAPGTTTTPTTATGGAAVTTAPTTAAATTAPTTAVATTAATTAAETTMAETTVAETTMAETTAAETTAAETTAAETTAAETMTAGATTAAGDTATAGGTATGGGALPSVAGLNLGTIKIATQGPLSGPQSQFGSTGRNGAELALQQIGQQIGFTNIELAPFDDQAQEPVGAANANTIAADPSILCVVGHINSGVALAALPVYRDANLVMISPANTNPRITDEFNDTAYRLVGRDDVQGVVAAEFAQNTLNAKNVYVLHDQTAYGEGLATVFRDTAQANGLNVLGFAGTQETAVFDAVLTPIQAANPDMVFFGGIYDRGGPLIQQMRERGITAPVLGGDGLDSSDLARLGGEGVVGVNYVTVSGPASAYPAAAQFAQDYQAQYNAPAGYPAFQAYDAMRACLVAIANAAIDANGTPTREQVQTAFEELEPFEGITGNVTFNEEGDRDPATYYILSVRSADPAQWNTNEVVGTVESKPPQD